MEGILGIDTPKCLKTAMATWDGTLDVIFHARCEICDEEFESDRCRHICPKCREAVMKVRKDIYNVQHNIGSYGCTVYCDSFNQPEVNIDNTVCGEGSVSGSSRKTVDGNITLTI